MTVLHCATPDTDRLQILDWTACAVVNKMTGLVGAGQGAELRDLFAACWQLVGRYGTPQEITMLPDLDSGVDAEIVSDNLLAVQAVYAACQLEQLRIFQVGERLVELFQQGMLPLGDGMAGRLQRFAAAGQRLTSPERARLYAQALGLPRGDPSVPDTNQEFITLWLRFMASVALFARQPDAASLLRPAVPASAVLRRAARALAVNASSHGAGMVQAAKQLSSEVGALQTLLQAPDITSAYGARDMWQVIDQVNRQYLGGAVNVHRYRSQAQAGAAVLRWLAMQAGALRGPALGTDVPFGDAGLAEAAEQWLAASVGPGDAAAPRIDLHAIAHELLQALGLAAAGSAKKHPPVVFCGAPGSGKSLAAHTLAVALARELHHVDLRRVVGKHAGETEKNLDKLLARAERADALLLFDEADALFGKRSEVKDAHDRYANLDVAYLLQRIEAHKGLVILECEAEPALTKASASQRVIRFPRPPRPPRP